MPCRELPQNQLATEVFGSFFCKFISEFLILFRRSTNGPKRAFLAMHSSNNSLFYESRANHYFWQPVRCIQKESKRKAREAGAYVRRVHCSHLPFSEILPNLQEALGGLGRLAIVHSTTWTGQQLLESDCGVVAGAFAMVLCLSSDPENWPRFIPLIHSKDRNLCMIGTIQQRSWRPASGTHREGYFPNITSASFQSKSSWSCIVNPVSGMPTRIFSISDAYRQVLVALLQGTCIMDLKPT